VGVSVNETIRTARLRLGLSENDVAGRAGLSWHEYFDLELHADEGIEVVHLKNMKRVAEVLHLDVLDLFGIRCAFCDHPERSVSGSHLCRNELVRQSREAMGLSQDDLANGIGFETVAVAQMESDPDFLESWSVGLVRELAGILAVPPQVLLDVRCATCGR
jgi:transcriptional regulator with XRE-family HTH domain